MHYGPTAFGKLINGVNQKTIRKLSNPADLSFGGSNSLSPGDVVGVNSMYPINQACGTLSALNPGELAVGQSRTIEVNASNSHNLSGIFMRQNQRVEFTTTSPGWRNGSNLTTCAGYNDTILDAGRRHSDLRMMALTGEIFNTNDVTSYSGTYVGIGCNKNWTATRSGYFVGFANDMLGAYGDNSGKVNLTVRRIQ